MGGGDVVFQSLQYLAYFTRFDPEECVIVLEAVLSGVKMLLSPKTDHLTYQPTPPDVYLKNSDRFLSRKINNRLNVYEN